MFCAVFGNLFSFWWVVHSAHWLFFVISSQTWHLYLLQLQQMAWLGLFFPTTLYGGTVMFRTHVSLIGRAAPGPEAFERTLYRQSYSAAAAHWLAPSFRCQINPSEFWNLSLTLARLQEPELNLELGWGAIIGYTIESLVKTLNFYE